jgi:hypothetical protein
MLKFDPSVKRIRGDAVLPNCYVELRIDLFKKFPGFLKAFLVKGINTIKIAIRHDTKGVFRTF